MLLTHEPSMESLVDELRLLIIDRLDDDALAKLCRVSKRYHGLVEPVLYKDITLMLADFKRIGAVLSMLLDRQDLAAKVKSFKVYSIPLELRYVRRMDEDEEFDNNLSETLWNRVPTLQRKIHYYSNLFNWTAELRIKWLASLLRFSEDALVALVLSLIVNVERFRLGRYYAGHPMNGNREEQDNIFLTSSILMQARSGSAQAVVVYPLSKLSELTLETELANVQLPVIPSLKILHIRDSENLLSWSPSVPSGMTKLVLGPGLEMNPRHIIESITSRRFEGLEELLIMESSYGNPVDNPHPDLQKAMALYLPNLRNFRFADMHDRWPRESGVGFESLVDCKNLSVLDIDDRAFQPGNRGHGLLEPLSRCPPCLQFLRLWSVDKYNLDLLSERYANGQYKLSAEPGYGIKHYHIVLEHSGSRIWEHNLSLDKALENLDPRVLTFLKSAVVELFARGIEFEVWGLFNPSHRKCKLLGPGFPSDFPLNVVGAASGFQYWPL